MKKKFGQEKKRSIPKPEPEMQSRVEPGASQKNPEFINQLADPELNPELALRIPDPTARLKEAKMCVDQFCKTFKVIVSLGSDPQGCYVDVTVTHTYSYEPGTNAYTLPHGIYVKVCQQAQIQSAQVISGTWFSGSTFVQDPNNEFVYWVKGPSTSIDYSKIIPSGQLLKARIKLTSGFCPGSCVVTVKELTGWAFSNNPQFWSCQRNPVITPLVVNCSIGDNTSVCTGTALTISVNAPAGSKVKWYKYIPTPSTLPCPPAPCPLGAPWVLVQTGGNTYNTNILDQTTCYVAVVEYVCSVTVTNVKRVEVCPAVPGNAITATGSLTTIINNVPHACTSWSGQLCLDPSTFPCSTTIVRWEQRTRTLSYPSACNPQWGQWTQPSTIPNSEGQMCISINTDNLLYKKACQRKFEFLARLENSCGHSDPFYNIVIDRPPDPGKITANPPPSLCFDKATKLSYSSTCAEVMAWEMRVELSPCTDTWGSWTAIDGSQGTCVWWTNNLLKITQYRVKVKNGACPLVCCIYSQVYTVTVKPPLGVTISANQTILCPPGVTLTAQTTYGPPCSYPVSYQWYQDGLPITGANDSTYSPTDGGNYYVEVSDTCGKATSNVITICNGPQLVIKAPCCICPGDTITLNAVVVWSPQNCPAPSCTYIWNTGEPMPSISVDSPGTYTVKVHCGTCPLMTKSVTIKPCLL